MHQHLYKPVEKLITRILSWWVKPDVLPVNPTELIDSTLPVLYILETGGLADRAALNIACAQFNLPPPADNLEYGTLTESSSVDVLKQRRGILFRRHRLVSSKRLKRVVNSRLLDNAGELQIVPVGVYWGRAPDKEQSVWSLFFSENWRIGSRTRKFITTLLFGRDTLLAFSEPLSLNTLLDSESDSPADGSNTEQSERQTERLQRKLSRILRVHFRQRRIASLGPDQSHRRMLVGQVLSDPGVRQAIQDKSIDSGKRLDRVQAEAEKYALEIAADVSYPTVRVLHRLMNRLWTELYDGVELSGIQRLKSVADGREIVYVPCHRSHIDYLLLSYILYVNGFSLPHIAAGINLNLPVVGGLLRRGGAFFLRRSFAGNRLYASVFNAYLKEILQRGHAIEYFVEGGRSRTGRLLPPKGGMLSMTAHAYLREPRTPVVFIPVYFGYERLLEGRAFTSELAGGKKQKETVFALIKSLKTLREEYGNVFVNFGTPIDLNTLLDKHKPEWRQSDTGPERPEWLNPIITELGENIMENINDAACITPISLLAMGLLSTRHCKLGRPELLEQMKVYHQLFASAASGTTAVVPDIDFEHAIEHGKKLGFVVTHNDSLGEVVSIKPGLASAMTYFRNNVQHMLAIPALIASCFSSTRRRTEEELAAIVQFAHPFLKTELFLVDKAPNDALSESLEALSNSGLLRFQNGEWRRPSAGSTEAVILLRLAEAVMPALERYSLVAAILEVSADETLTEEVLAERCMACADRLAKTEGRESGDLYDKHVHKVFMQNLLDHDYIVIKDDCVTATNKLRQVAAQTKTLVSEPMRHAILHASMQVCSTAAITD